MRRTPSVLQLCHRETVWTLIWRKGHRVDVAAIASKTSWDRSHLQERCIYGTPAGYPGLPGSPF